MNLAQIWPPEMAICTCLLEISLIIEAVFLPQSACPGHVWCPRLCRISCTLGPAGCSHWNQLSGAAGGTDLHGGWSFTWDMVKVREKEMGVWGAEKGERLQAGMWQAKTWIGKWSGRGKRNEGVRLGWDCGKKETLPRWWCDLPLLATSVAFILHSFIFSISIYSQWHSQGTIHVTYIKCLLRMNHAPGLLISLPWLQKACQMISSDGHLCRIRWSPASQPAGGMSAAESPGGFKPRPMRTGHSPSPMLACKPPAGHLSMSQSDSPAPGCSVHSSVLPSISSPGLARAGWVLSAWD